MANRPGIESAVCERIHLNHRGFQATSAIAVAVALLLPCAAAGAWTARAGDSTQDNANSTAATTSAASSPAPAADPWIGAWEGALDVGPAKLRLVFHITKEDGGGYGSTLDSIDQGARGIPVASVTVDGDSISMDLPSVRGRYDGKRAPSQNELAGEWKQSGQTFPLALKRVDKPSELVRPQHPKPPFPYEVLEVDFENVGGGAKLAGTLTVPPGEGPFPAALLITGSGAQDRDETIFGHKPFLVLADHLTRQGVVVLRTDDRGIGGSTGEAEKATSEDFAGDVMAGVEFLKKRPEVDPRKIGLVGHSEGGMIAPMVAVRTKDVAYIVLMAGTAVPGDELLYLQSALLMRAGGASDEEVQDNRKLQEKIFRLIREEPSLDKGLEQARQLLREHFAEIPEAQKAQAGNIEQYVAQHSRVVGIPWFRYFVTYDPRTTLRKVTCPVLAINGEKDLQVSPKQNLPEIEKALTAAGNKDVTVRELPGLNHLFQHATTGAVTEYGQIEETFSPEALEIISDWIQSRFGRKPGH